MAHFGSASKSEYYQGSSPHEPLACPLWRLLFSSLLLHVSSMAAAAPAILSVFKAGRRKKLCLSPAMLRPYQERLSQMPSLLPPQTLH